MAITALLFVAGMLLFLVVRHISCCLSALPVGEYDAVVVVYRYFDEACHNRRDNVQFILPAGATTDEVVDYATRALCLPSGCVDGVTFVRAAEIRAERLHYPVVQEPIVRHVYYVLDRM